MEARYRARRVIISTIWAKLCRGRTHLPTTVHGIRIGSVALLGFPGEPFAEIGERVRDASPFEYTHMAGYSNGHTGYVPTAEEFERGGYEPNWATAYTSEAALRAGARSRLAPRRSGGGRHGIAGVRTNVHPSPFIPRRGAPARGSQPFYLLPDPLGGAPRHRRRQFLHPATGRNPGSGGGIRIGKDRHRLLPGGTPTRQCPDREWPGPLQRQEPADVVRWRFGRSQGAKRSPWSFKTQ